MELAHISDSDKKFVIVEVLWYYLWGANLVVYIVYTLSYNAWYLKYLMKFELERRDKLIFLHVSSFHSFIHKLFNPLDFINF
jgi:hypothetical protein